MPMLVKDGFPDTGPAERAELIAFARGRLEADAERFAEVNRWIEAEYSVAKGTKRSAERLKRNKAVRAGQIESPTREVPPLAEVKPRGRAPGFGDSRLEWAIRDLVAANQGAGPGRLLGPNQPKRDRTTSAWRALVVGLCVIDPDADEWLAGAVAIASVPWKAKQGREFTFSGWGWEALDLAKEAAQVLGWQPASKNPPPTLNFNERHRRSLERDRLEREKIKVIARLANLDRPLEPEEAILQLRALASLTPAEQIHVVYEDAGLIALKMARQGFFSDYPEARKLALAHTARAAGPELDSLWSDFASAMRRQQGLPQQPMWESLPQDATAAADSIHAALTGRKATDESKWPTQSELLAATEAQAERAPAISATIFRELVAATDVRRAKRGEKNRRYSPDEVRALIEAADRLGKQDRARIRRSWEPFASPLSKSRKDHGKIA